MNRYISTGEKTVLLAKGILFIAEANNLSYNDIGFAEAEKKLAEFSSKYPVLYGLAKSYQEEIFNRLTD